MKKHLSFASFAFGLLAFASFVAACSSSTSSGNAAPPPAGNGVNDVAKACAIRTTWQNASSGICNQCMGLAIAPHCDCETEEYGGRCNAQQTAKAAEPSCDGVGACLGGCKVDDCACIDGCYAGKDACRTVSSAVDGCVADVCTTYCR